MVAGTSRRWFPRKRRTCECTCAALVGLGKGQGSGTALVGLGTECWEGCSLGQVVD